LLLECLDMLQKTESEHLRKSLKFCQQNNQIEEKHYRADVIVDKKKTTKKQEHLKKMLRELYRFWRRWINFLPLANPMRKTVSKSLFYPFFATAVLYLCVGPRYFHPVLQGKVNRNILILFSFTGMQRTKTDFRKKNRGRALLDPIVPLVVWPKTIIRGILPTWLC